jgi:hypothetical protein
MKPQILTVKPALAGANATSPTSRMVKVQEGRCFAYGGTFCLSTPIQSSLDCGFLPDPVLAFFNREREGATFTEHNGRLLMRHEGMEVSTPVVPAQSIPVLRTLGVSVPVTEQIEHLNTIASLCRNMTEDWRQAAWFKDGSIYAMKGNALCFVTEGVTSEQFGLPAESVQALARIKLKLVNFVKDQQSVQFEFEDGTWLASRLVDGLQPPDFTKVFDVPDACCRKIVFNPAVVAEVLAFKLHGDDNGEAADMKWFGKDGVLTFEAPDNTSGTFENAYTAGGNFCIKGESFRTILALEPEDLVLTYREGYAASLNGYGNGFAIAGALMKFD